MANEMDRNTGLRLDIESLWTNLEQVRDFAASREAQEMRAAAMSTPTGEALYAGIRGAFEAVEVPGDAEIAAAQEELLGIVAEAGASRELVGQLRQVMADPSLLQDEGYAAELEAQVSALDMVAVQAGVHPGVRQGDLFAMQQSGQADTASHGAATDVQATATRLHQLVREMDSTGDPGVTHVGASVPPNLSASADTLVQVPTADATPEELAEFDRRARAYAESQSVDLDHRIDSSDPDNKVDNYSSLVMYLMDRQDDDELNKDNVRFEDYNVICTLAYARKFSSDTGYRIAAGRENVTIREYCDALLAADELAAESKMSEKDRAFLIALRNSNRYANLHIDHVDALDVGNVNTNIVTFRTEGGHAFIGIEGTNGTVTDWINNTEFSRGELSEEEKWIFDRIDEYLDKYESFDITGHSQGGRDAITTAALLDPSKKAKLRKIFSMDGPGYPRAFLDKYEHLIKQVEDKIVQIFPSTSYVGQLMERVGLEENCYYVVTQREHDDEIDLQTHDNARWVMRDPEGHSGFIFTEQHPISKFLRRLTTIAVDMLPPEVLNEYLPIVFRNLASVKDPTEMVFDATLWKFDKLSVDQATDLLQVALIALVDGAELTFMDYMMETLEDIDGILGLLERLPAIKQVRDMAKAGRSVFRKVDAYLEMAGAYIKITARLKLMIQKMKAESRRAARAAYLASHDEITMNYAALKKAADCMRRASRALEEADGNCDAMWNCFLKDEAVEGTETDDNGILRTIWHVVATAVSPRHAMEQIVRRAALAAIDLACLTSNPYCNKGADAIDVVIKAAKAVQLSCGGSPDEAPFTVNPGALAQRGDEGISTINGMLETIRNTEDSIEKLGRSWQSEDYDHLNKHANKMAKDVQTVMEAIRNDYQELKQIAEAYSIMQRTAVREFQAAVN